MTAHELFVHHLISATRKELGEPHAKFADYEHTRNLKNFADATQQIHLNLPALFEQRQVEWRKRTARRSRLDSEQVS